MIDFFEHFFWQYLFHSSLKNRHRKGSSTLWWIVGTGRVYPMWFAVSWTGSMRLTRAGLLVQLPFKSKSSLWCSDRRTWKKTLKPNEVSISWGVLAIEVVMVMILAREESRVPRPATATSHVYFSEAMIWKLCFWFSTRWFCLPEIFFGQ